MSCQMNSFIPGRFVLIYLATRVTCLFQRRKNKFKHRLNIGIIFFKPDKKIAVIAKIKLRTVRMNQPIVNFVTAHMQK